MTTPAAPWNRVEGKIQPWHLDRLAVVYVRQSTPQQVIDHAESTRLQYGLRQRAVELGWDASRVLVIYEDLGHSASGLVARPGFQRLVSEVGLDHVGLVLGVEMSRLACSGREWHQLLELCALAGALLADPVADSVLALGRAQLPARGGADTVSVPKGAIPPHAGL
ncbi:recombinase family protein [Streptomyces coerulescens]|uniref:Recombinase family protein n=1 Tax=Streptomyces coerulescens TaxID=29304 RepID=A0ABW0CSR9_STRCD